MKKSISKLLTITLANLLIITSIFAQTPEKMSYQAVVRDGNNALVTNTQIGMQVSILQGSANGTVVYTETQTPNTNANGLVSIEIGANAEFSNINWANDIYFIKTETDPTGGENYTITGTSQLLSVPYALNAKTAESFTGTITENDPVFTEWDKNYNDLTNLPTLFDGQYSNLTGSPVIPTDLEDLTDNTSLLFSRNYNDLLNLPSLFDGDWYSLSNTPTTISAYGITDAFDGQYSSLTGTPTIPTDLENLTDNTSLLFSGNYNDLTNKPIITDNQTLSEVLTENNDGGAIQIKNIAAPTEAQDAATKAYVDELRSMILDLQAAVGVTDSRDGTHYNAVRIGNQVWMAENLKYLPEVVGSGTGSATDTYYYVYDYNGTDIAVAKTTANYTTYGVLYNWSAAMSGSASSVANPSGVQGVCPAGWHLPSDAEWTELTDYLGGESVAGGKLKETGTTHWISPNAGATNETGFTALSGGRRSDNGAFNYMGSLGYWWCATESGTNNAWEWYMGYGTSEVYRYNNNKVLGLSVRCVRD